MKYHGTHPGLACGVAVKLPPNFIVCECGAHYIFRGQRTDPGHCRRDDWWTR